MIVNLSMPDELYQEYVKQMPQNPQKGIVRTLERFKDVGQERRFVILYGEDLAQIQKLAGRTVETPEHVVKLVTEALSIRVDDFRVPLTEGQRKRLKQNAHFFGQTPEAYGASQLKEIIAAKFGV